MRVLSRLVATFAAVSLIAVSPPALAADSGTGASDEAAPPAESVPALSRAAQLAAGVTTTYVDDAGRKVFRVDDGFDLDQYLYHGTLSFSFDIEEDYGPVDEHGHPAPGNRLYGKQMLLTLRAWDVDEISGEVDMVRFNSSQLIPGQLGGADGQWATDTFDVWASWLRLPTPENPTGTNTVTIDIDVNNDGWAVEVDWAELRPYVDDDAVRPVVLAHGITDNDSGAGRSGMWEFDDYLQETVPQLDGRTASPPMTEHGSIQANAAILGDAVNEIVDGEPSDQVDIVGHSMGGLDARLYGFLNPGRVRNLVMVATPNHGSELATHLCALRLLGSNVASEFGECDGQDDGLFQLMPGYVEKFNEVVTDLPSVNYRTIAGRKSGTGSVLIDGIGIGIDGEDDGTVSVKSVRWLSIVDDDHPGLHFSEYPTVDRDHMGLIHERGGEDPLSYAMAACIVAYDELDFCPLPSGLDGTESAEDVMSARALPTEAAPSQIGVGPSGVVAAGATATVLVDVAEGERAGLVVLADDGLELTLDGGTLASTDVFGVPAQGATLDGPATLVVHNPTIEPLEFGSMLGVVSDRTLSLVSPSHVAAGAPLEIEATMTGARDDERIAYVVTDSTGATVADGVLAADGEGVWGGQAASPGPGTYTVLLTTDGPAARVALGVVSVLGGGAFAGGFDERTTDADLDGLIDSLRLEVPVEVDRPGEYQLSVRVLDAQGALVAAGGTRAQLDGPGSFTLDLDGRAIHDAGLEGPWTVQAVLSDDQLTLIDLAELGTVANDRPAEYEHDVLSVADFTEEALDADVDGLIETLRISGVARTDASGTYALNGKLVAADGTEVGRSTSTVRLNPGETAIHLEFDGASIGATGKDGPYTLRDLTLYPTTSPTGGVALVDAYRTSPYLSAQFPGGLSADEPPTAEARIVSVDGLRVVLDASGSSDDHGVAAIDWDLGDGTTASGSVVDHRYPAPGSYVVTVTVTDTSGQRVSATVTATAEVPRCDGLVATIVGDGDDIVGTSGPDVIVGTDDAERIDGGLGNDIICGEGGNDTLVGANDRDRLFGGDGNDRLEGGDGDDHLEGGGGDDTVVGANGKDQLIGGDGADIVLGGDGSDVLDGGDGDDILLGANGDDRLDGGDGNDILEGGDGADVLTGGTGDDSISAANGNDVIDAGEGDDVVIAGEGADVVAAGAGDDRVLAGGGADIVRAGGGSDYVEGGEGNDRLWGEDADDFLLGQGGNDEIDGGRGVDVIDGGNGRNVIRDEP